MRLHVRHTTRYRFDSPVSYGLQQVRKTPVSAPFQQVLNWSTHIENGQKEAAFKDHHGNVVELMSIDKDATELVVTSAGEVQLTDTSGISGPHLGPAALWLFERATPSTEAKAGVKALAKAASGEDTLGMLHDLSARIREAVSYEVGVSETEWSAEDAIAAGRGVCQDHTHIFLACARHLKIPARYVSGYLMLDETTAQDAMHAWAEAHIDGLGWVGFDISNGISPDTRYIRVSTGLDYADAAPISGTRQGGAGEHLSVDIHVAQQ